MTQFVAALLIAAGGTVRAQVDPCTPGAGDLGPVQPADLLASAVTRTRRERAAGEGVEAMRRAGRTAWQQRGGAA